MNPEEDKDKKLEEALYTLAIGATVEEIGKDAKGATKVFKRKLAPNLYRTGQEGRRYSG